eukprot:3893491-Prymnesium_polylepis.1
MLVLWWRVQMGHGSGAQPKELASDFTHRAPRTHIIMPCIMRPDPAVDMYYAARSGRGEQPFW